MGEGHSHEWAVGMGGAQTVTELEVFVLNESVGFVWHHVTECSQATTCLVTAHIHAFGTCHTNVLASSRLCM